ncbi:sperm microtubule associated protein 2-like isoform X2 [Narcine bancroftii]|uniref:sperm microtubule associated protein 2-like isoform X2 n=1 Tax=Narcine bancroftii TaxID=1343680 RepID=UPI003832185B
MDTKSDGPVGPETGDGQSNEKGKKKISRNTGSTPRYIKLSEHKKPNKNFQPNRPAIWPVKPATMKAQPTARINELAKPKPNHDGFKARESEGKSKTVSRKGPKDKTTGSKKEPVIYADVPRFVYLSEPKKLTPHYIPSRSSPEWPLRWETLNAGASSRIHELAKPKQVHRDWQADRSPYAMPDLLCSTSLDIMLHEHSSPWKQEERRMNTRLQ